MNRSIKRIMLDVKDILSSPIDNIYYIPDDTVSNIGYAMIIGPNNTPYDNGYYFFEFKYPDNYPFSPPTVTFKTYDGRTRFNPNLYINGYVCLSVLNTWPGDKWSSCQSIRSILLCLSTLFNENPLYNEPGIYKNHPDIIPYNRIIFYRNIQIAILLPLTKNNLLDKYKAFHSIIISHFIKNKDYLLSKISKEIIEESPSDKTSIYNLYCKTNYKQLAELVDIYYNELIKIDK